MNHTITLLPGLEVALTAHRDESASLLLAVLKAAEPEDAVRPTALKVALVIDRSGSMSGEKLEITKAAAAQFIRSLSPQDRVCVIAYDDEVYLLQGMEAPSEALAQAVESIQDRGSTNLYGGWVLGAKLVGREGRVILLSDGQANAGPYSDADSLSLHAGISYQKYGVTTTTIGVGRDYDEGLMAGMARKGGGAHYFAHSAEAIAEAFNQERYSAGSVALERLIVQCNGVEEQLGHFWGGETKKRVFPVSDLAGLKFTVRYGSKALGHRQTFQTDPPTSFGHSEEATLEALLQRAGQVEEEMLRVRDPRTAGEMKDRLRKIVLEILAHPSSDAPEVRAAVDRLKASITRLEQLEIHYVEEDAMMHRKRSMQTSHNLRERAKSYSSFEDEKAALRNMSSTSHARQLSREQLVVCQEALSLVPIEKWIEWEVMPVAVVGQHVVVASEDPRRGFGMAQIEAATGRRVKPMYAGVTATELVQMMREHR